MEPTPRLKQAVIDYKSGKQDAFTVLYEESCKYVYVCIHKIVKDCDNAQEVTNDLMQDTYLEISRHISQLEDEDRFLSWSGSIATRKCYAYLKKDRKYILLSQEEEALEKITDDENLIPEEIMQNREKQRLIQEIIDTRLTPLQRLCVIAFYYHGQKQSEIAKELGIPENTVKTHLSRAKARIKEGVLDLEKKEGTRLYSIAPLLLLLFREEMEACIVPRDVTTRILKPRKAMAPMGKAGAAVLKTKLIVAVIAMATLGAVVGSVLINSVNPSRQAAQFSASQQEETQEDSQEETESLYASWPEWAVEGKKYLLRQHSGYKFDINDFEEDGEPEFVVFDDEMMHIVTYCNQEDKKYNVYSYYFTGTHEDETRSGSWINIWGYGMNNNELIALARERVENAEGGYQIFCINTECYTPMMTWTRYSTNFSNAKWKSRVSEQATESSGFKVLPLSEEEKLAFLREQAACFNEIILTDVEPSAIDERIEEFLESGNRPRSRRTEEEVDTIFQWARETQP